MKKDNFSIFIELIRDQFVYGGIKYGDPNSKTKETTDTLFDTHGKNWLFGTIDKYTFRFKNLARERDLLKIATYMYILWLKRGFFVQRIGINDPPLNTTVKVKSEQFESFLTLVKKEKQQVYWDKNKDDKYQSKLDLNVISQKLVEFSKLEWKYIAECDIINIFLRAYRVWYIHFRNVAGKDTDTWNEKEDVKA